MPVEAGDRVERLQRELAECEDHEDVRLRGLQAGDLALDVRARRVVADLRGNRARLLPEPLLEPREQVASVLVVLVEDGDPRPLHAREDVVAVDPSLLRVRRDVADRPRVLLVVAAERGRAGGDEELRDVVVVQEVPDREIVRGAERVEHPEDLVLLDEPDRVLHRPGRVVGVVEVLVGDLSPEHAAVVVDVLEVVVRAAGDVPGGGRLAAQRNAAAELDRVGADARRREWARACGSGDDGRSDGADDETPPHAHNYDRVYKRVVSGLSRRRSNPPAPVGSRSITTISTAPNTTLGIPGCFGSRSRMGSLSSQPATVSAWNWRK